MLTRFQLFTSADCWPSISISRNIQYSTPPTISAGSHPGLIQTMVSVGPHPDFRIHSQTSSVRRLFDIDVHRFHIIRRRQYFRYVEMQPPLILASSLHLDCRQHHSSRHRSTTRREDAVCMPSYLPDADIYTDIYLMLMLISITSISTSYWYLLRYLTSS